jgi:hypothetical protein
MTDIENINNEQKQSKYIKKYYTEKRKQYFKDLYQNKKLELKLKREQQKGNENITINDIRILGRGQPPLPEDKKRITKQSYNKLCTLLNKMEKMGIESEDIQNKKQEYENELTRRQIIKA